MLLEYAGKQGWELYRLYCDEDCTGADRRRPEFNRLLQDAEQRRFDIVLCKTQSRFTRELELVEKYIHGLFPLWGIRFVSVVDNADKDPEKKGHLLIDEEAAAVVREVFTRFAQGCGKTAIARSLNDRGIPNPTEYKRLQGLRYQQPRRQNGTLWKYFSISHTLVNPVYIGNLVQGKTGSVSYKTKQCKPRPPASGTLWRARMRPSLTGTCGRECRPRLPSGQSPLGEVPWACLPKKPGAPSAGTP